MKEERFFYAPDASSTDELPEQEALHATRVLRLAEGDKIFLMDGKGSFYCAAITLATKKRCLYRIVDVMPQQKSWTGHVHLAIAPTKMMERMEWMVEKAVEIGVDEISFIDCHFSERQSIRIDRIEKIAIAAMKQSRKPFKPIINGLSIFPHFIAKNSVVPDNEIMRTRHFIAHCYNEFPRHYLFNELKNMPLDGNVTMLVGPEGDFSIDEVRLAIDQGYEPVTLGSSRLRTETAGLMAVAMAQLAKAKTQE